MGELSFNWKFIRWTLLYDLFPLENQSSLDWLRWIKSLDFYLYQLFPFRHNLFIFLASAKIYIHFCFQEVFISSRDVTEISLFGSPYFCQPLNQKLFLCEVYTGGLSEVPEQWFLSEVTLKQWSMWMNE